LRDAGSPRYTSPASQRALTGAATAFVVVFALCQSPASNLGRDQAEGPSFPTGPPTTPPSLPSCGWLRPTPSSSCASTRLAAATTASPAVEWRPIRPVRAEPPRETIRITTGMATTTINRAKAQRGIGPRPPAKSVAGVWADHAWDRAAPRQPSRRQVVIWIALFQQVRAEGPKDQRRWCGCECRRRHPQRGTCDRASGMGLRATPQKTQQISHGNRTFRPYGMTIR
jgi:hypothetical protein